MGNTRHPTILCDKVSKSTKKSRRERMRSRETNEPSVILFQPRYKTPTAAVSSKVARNDPSTFESEAYTKKGSSQFASRQSTSQASI
jgi:hypothetical protein